MGGPDLEFQHQNRTKKIRVGAGVMAQQPRVRIALTVDPTSVPSTQLTAA